LHRIPNESIGKSLRGFGGEFLRSDCIAAQRQRQCWTPQVVRSSAVTGHRVGTRICFFEVRRDIPEPAV